QGSAGESSCGVQPDGGQVAGSGELALEALGPGRARFGARRWVRRLGRRRRIGWRRRCSRAGLLLEKWRLLLLVVRALSVGSASAQKLTAAQEQEGQCELPGAHAARIMTQPFGSAQRFGRKRTGE